MAHLVIAYPTLSPADFDWIQQYRAANDLRFVNVVDPHFTIVFPIADMDERSFLATVKSSTSGATKIVFEIRVATMSRHISGAPYHEFLVPDKGYSDVVKLHDRLYTGALAKYLRLDVDYIPHIGIGTNDETHVAKAHIDACNREGVSIDGTIEALDIVEYSGGRVRTIEKVALQ